MGGPPLTRRELGIAIGFVLGSVLAIFLVWTSFGGTLPFESDGYRLTIAFPNAPTLVAGADVRISGVPIGKVVAVRAGEAATDATIQIDPQYVPLRADARAIIRTKTPLGESYVEVTPGTTSSPALADGARLPSSQVVPSEQIQDLLGTFDAPTRKAFNETVVDAAAALDGEGPNLNDALGASAPASTDLNVMLQALDSQSHDVQVLISRSATTLRALSADPSALRRLIDSGDQVVATTAHRSAELTATVRALAPFVAELTPTAAALAKTAELATPTLRTLAPVTPLVLPALRATEALAPRLTAVFRSLRPVLRHATADLDAATRLVDQVPGLGSALDAAGRQLVPLVELLAAYRHDAVESLASFASVLEPLKGTAGSTYSRYARTAILTSSEGDLGFAKRPPYVRYNPYPPPGALGDGDSLGCANVENPVSVPAAGSQVPCVVQAPWTFRGSTRSFPKLTPYAPTPLPR